VECSSSSSRPNEFLGRNLQTMYAKPKPQTGAGHLSCSSSHDDPHYGLRLRHGGGSASTVCEYVCVCTFFKSFRSTDTHPTGAVFMRRWGQAGSAHGPGAQLSLGLSWRSGQGLDRRMQCPGGWRILSLGQTLLLLLLPCGKPSVRMAHSASWPGEDVQLTTHVSPQAQTSPVFYALQSDKSCSTSYSAAMPSAAVSATVAGKRNSAACVPAVCAVLMCVYVCAWPGSGLGRSGLCFRQPDGKLGVFEYAHLHGRLSFSVSCASHSKRVLRYAQIATIAGAWRRQGPTRRFKGPACHPHRSNMPTTATRTHIVLQPLERERSSRTSHRRRPAMRHSLARRSRHWPTSQQPTTACQ
jgi:hypothetical protein